MPDYDCLVIGGGSGGIGAALAAASHGANTLLIEKAPDIGGNAVRGGVHVWEPVAGATGIPFDVYRRLMEINGAVAITSLGRHVLWDDSPLPFPGSEKLPDPDRVWADTLQRHGFRSMAEDEDICRRFLHSVIFEPQMYVRVVRRMLDQVGCEVRCETAAAGARVQNGHVSSLQLDDGSILTASTYIDCTGDAVVCEACGCEMMVGQEGRHRFDEPHAPPEPTDRINGASLIYRVTPTDDPAVEPLPEEIPEDCWWRSRFPSAVFTKYPCTDINVNMLPTLTGEELVSLGRRAVMEEAQRRIRAHWHSLQSTFDEFRGFLMSRVAPQLGVREGPRVVTEYVLDENDLLTGLSGQSHTDIIAIADHAMDTHGYGGCRELAEPYGIPYRSLRPAAFDNLLVACRGAGFSSIAASSCRLSRTMMQLGQAAGSAAAIAAETETAASEVSIEQLRDMLRSDGVQLQWPMSEKVRSRIGPRTVL